MNASRSTRAPKTIAVGAISLLRLHAAEARPERSRRAATGGREDISVESCTMSRWHNYYPDCHAFFCTFTVADWQPLLGGPAVEVLHEEWEKARASLGVRVLAYCVMPNHVHMLLWAKTGESVKKFLHRTIAQTSRRLKPGGGFWKERPRVLPIHSKAVLRAKKDYLHLNPVRAGLVQMPEQWPHSSYAQLELGLESSEFACDSWDVAVV